MTDLYHHDWRFDIGATYATVRILGRIRAGATQRADRYQVRMLCCGTICEMTHAQIRERIRHLEAKRCRHCLNTSNGAPIPGRPTCQPQEELGPLQLLQQVDERSWHIRWTCCGREKTLSRGRILDIAAEVRRGGRDQCPDCTRAARKAGALDWPAPAPATVPVTVPVYVPLVVPYTKPPVATTRRVAALAPTHDKIPYFPADYLGPDRLWPRPPSLTQPPAIWGAQW